MVEKINYGDNGKVAREKINNILQEVEDHLPSIWENNHWYLWETDTWISATWPQWPQWATWPQWEKGNQWPQWATWPQWEQGIQWIQGEPWDAFQIYKTYPSIASMEADKDNVPEWKFVLIASSIEDPDNAKLYVKGDTGFVFLADMSGATGIQWPQWEQGIQGVQWLPWNDWYSPSATVTQEGKVTTITITDEQWTTSKSIDLNWYATSEEVEEWLEEKQDTLEAWDNIEINWNTISATDTKYTAGEWIAIDENNVISNTQTSAERWNIEWDISNQTDLVNELNKKQNKLTAWTDIEIIPWSWEEKEVSGNNSIILEKAVEDWLNSVTISWGTKQNYLPDWYTEYEYIHTAGKYFVTDYYPNNKTEVKTKIFMNGQPWSPLVTRWTTSPTNDTFWFYMWNVSNRLTFFYGTYNNSKYTNVEWVKTNMEHSIYMWVNSIVLDWTSYSTTRSTFTSTQPIYIGAFNQTGTSLAGTLTGRIYKVEFIENWNVIRRYIPCKNANNEIWLYETATGTFITSAGTGNLKSWKIAEKSDTLPSEYTRLDYIQATGTQYIDSGVVGNFANNKIEQNAVVEYTTSSSDRELMWTNWYWFWGKSASNKIEAALWQMTVTDNALTKNKISWTTDPTDSNKLILNVNSNQYTSTASSFVDADYSYYIFALWIRVWSGASASFFCKAKIYSYAISLDDEVVCDLVPCKRNSDNVLWMYDLVNWTFKTNEGTGTFTAGGNYSALNPSNPQPIISNNGQLKLGWHGKNLFNKDSIPYLTGAYISSATVGQSTFNTTTNANYNIYCIEIKPNTTYTFGLIKANDPRWTVTDGSIILDTGYNSGGSAGTYITITTGATAKYLYLSVAISGNYKCDDVLQVEEGSEHTEYEAFHYILVAEGMTETITDSANNTATAEMLLSMGNYTDTQELLTGAVTRKIWVIILDGTENWGLYATNNGYRSFRVNSFLSAKASRGICTHLPYYDFISSNMDRECVAIGGNKTTFYINLAGEERTVDDLKDWLASQYAAWTPVMFIYPLATETTETVTGQTLTTIQWDNTLTITQASIDNLPIEANYTTIWWDIISFVNDSGYAQIKVWEEPETPTEWLLWYDTTNSELKIYIWNEWKTI